MVKARINLIKFKVMINVGQYAKVWILKINNHKKKG